MQRRVQAFVIGLLALGAGSINSGWAEQAPYAPSPQVCPQDDTGRSQTPRGTPGPTDNPRDRLADSKDVICPPDGIDPDIRVKPADGGDPNAQPK
jgi:hypothetical protein